LLVSWLKRGNDILGSREACPMVVLGIASVALLSRNDRGRGKAINNVIANDRRECGKESKTDNHKLFSMKEKKWKKNS